MKGFLIARPAAVSPGLQPRPSLSDDRRFGRESAPIGVAGVTAPALIERRSDARSED